MERAWDTFKNDGYYFSSPEGFGLHRYIHLSKFNELLFKICAFYCKSILPKKEKQSVRKY